MRYRTFRDFKIQSRKHVVCSKYSRLSRRAPGLDSPFRDHRRSHPDANAWRAHPDPVGISAGVLVFFYAVYSLIKYQREANRIISLFEANTQIKELSEKAARGEPLPSIVVIRGHIGADGGDVNTVSGAIHGLRERIGEIEQPKNAWIEIARQAKSDPQLRGVADAVVQRTGWDIDGSVQGVAGF